MVNSKKLNIVSSLGQLQVLDSLGKEFVFSLSYLVSSSHRITINKDIDPFTAFCTTTQLFK